MASFPNPQAVTYEQWLNRPEVDGREEVVNGVIHLIPPNKSWHARIPVLREDILKPITLPSVQIDIAQVWPD